MGTERPGAGDGKAEKTGGEQVEKDTETRSQSLHGRQTEGERIDLFSDHLENHHNSREETKGQTQKTGRLKGRVLRMGDA